ncbi:MAG: DUF1559 domain-containing protein [Pirellula sp.]
MASEIKIAANATWHAFARVLSHVFRVAIAFLLIASGLVHLQNVPAHFVAIANYRIVPVLVGQVFAFLLPSLHVVIGVTLLVSEYRWCCYFVSAGLFGTYLVAQLTVLFRGLRIDCGCLGPSVSSTVGVDTIVRTLALLLICFWLAWNEEERPRFRVWRPLSRRSISRQAMALIELLVCISIIGLLVALILPSVQSARESARRMSCMNNQKQLVLAAQLHEGAHKKFPSTGWGYNWVGMHDQGTGKKQPGSWIFSVLPFLEQGNLWTSSPTLLRPHTSDQFQRFVLEKMPQLVCTSKGLNDPLSATETVSYRYGTTVKLVSRGDYAINAGDKLLINNAGPTSIGDNSFVWPNHDKPSGMAYTRSEVRYSDITDGITNVFYCGEKWSERDGDPDRGYDQPWISGDSQETRRFTEFVILRDGSTEGSFERFGSSHPDGVVFGFVDGSVRLIQFSIHPNVFKTLGNRFDGNNGVSSVE